jgi:hypothetical protein
MSRALANKSVCEKSGEPNDAIRARKLRTARERPPADRQRMPGLWERSRLNSEIDSPLITDPPEPDAPEGFLLSEASLKICPAKAGTGDPDPGARAATRVPKSAGPAGGNEAMSRTPMAE